MKKHTKFFILTLSSALILFSSCFNAVFYYVNQDIPPEPSTVKGVITSICRYTVDDKEYLFLNAEGGLRYKSTEIGNDRGSSGQTSWSCYPEDKLPFSLHKYSYYNDVGTNHTGQQIIKILADKSTLYLVTTDYKQDEEKGISAPNNLYVWATQLKLNADKNDLSLDNEWKEIKFAETQEEQKKLFSTFFLQKIGYSFNNYNVFSTNSINPEHRRVFVRSGNEKNDDVKYFELKGLEAPEDVTEDVKSKGAIDYRLLYPEEDKLDVKAAMNIDGAAYLGDELYFFDTNAVTSNETLSNNSTYIYFGCVESDFTYYTRAGLKQLNCLYKEAGELKTSVVLSQTGDAVLSLATTKDALLIGRGDTSFNSMKSGGIIKVQLDENGKPETSISPFTTNAAIQLSDSYQIFTLLVVNPDKKETETTIYSSIVFKGDGLSYGVIYDNIGLWAYYPERGNWNCE